MASINMHSIKKTLRGLWTENKYDFIDSCQIQVAKLWSDGTFLNESIKFHHWQILNYQKAENGLFVKDSETWNLDYASIYFDTNTWIQNPDRLYLVADLKISITDRKNNKIMPS